MHIRSGDEFLFDQFNNHPIYVLQHSAYYKKIIDKYYKVYDEFIIITAPDMLNPTI